MSVYFFHITEGDKFIPDPEGIEQPDLAAVREAAIKGASELIAGAVKNGERDYAGRLDVEDERGNTVLTVTFACPIGIEAAPFS